jgi:glycosyltransferase involved in cell wall biosynthesis
MVTCLRTAEPADSVLDRIGCMRGEADERPQKLPRIRTSRSSRSASATLRVGIDARYLTHSAVGGYQTYVQELVAALNRIERSVDIVVFVAEKSPRLDTVNRLDQVVEPVWPPFVGIPWREQWTLPRLARGLGLDLMHYPTNTMPTRPLLPSVVTIHDTIVLRGGVTRPGLRNRLTHYYERYGLRNALRRAEVVITVSSRSARDIIAVGGHRDRVREIAQGVASPFLVQPTKTQLATFRRHHGLSPPYLLTLASSDPRKNVDRAVQAFALSAKRDPSLSLAILLSAAHWKQRLVSLAEQLGVADRIVFLEPLPSTDDMVLLYAGASALVFVSLDEGFGLPPLESMASGTPVICSRRPPMSYLFHGAAAFVDPMDVASIAAAIQEVISNEQVHEELAERGRHIAARYTWENTARATIRAYHHAVESPL